MTQNCLQQQTMVIVPFNQWILLTETYGSLKQAREKYKDQDMAWPNNHVLIPGTIFTKAKALESPVQWVVQALSLGVKWPGHEADHSPPSSADIYSQPNYTFTLPQDFMLSTRHNCVPTVDVSGQVFLMLQPKATATSSYMSHVWMVELQLLLPLLSQLPLISDTFQSTVWQLCLRVHW